MKLVWKQFTVAVVVGFLLGGTFGTWHARTQLSPRFGWWKMKHGDGTMRQRMLERFSRELKLTPEQQTKMGEIFGAAREQMLAMRSEMRPRFEALRQSTDESIRQMLTPEQQAKFEQLKAARQCARGGGGWWGRGHGDSSPDGKPM